MMDENEQDSAIEYAFRFGEIAIMKGFKLHSNQKKPFNVAVRPILKVDFPNG